MSTLSRLLGGLVLAAGIARVHSAPTKDHDKIVGFADGVTSTPDAVDPAYVLSTPYLKVVGGCVPFPAVDKDGYVSGGLAATGNENGDCDKSTGQVYGRTATYNGKTAVMWSWYFPKDDPPNFGNGHRHDWENIVVWFDDVSASTLYGISYSGHGEYDKIKAPATSLSDTAHPFARYYSAWPLNHQLGSTTTKGGTQPAITWEELPAAAKSALEEHDFGSANVPFKEANFESNLGKAWIE